MRKLNKAIISHDRSDFTLKKPVEKLTKAMNAEGTLKKTGEMLVDLTATGKDRGWAERKGANTKLAESYGRIGMKKKSEKINDCARKLLFKECPEGHEKNLIGTFTCKARLCPVCQWRRSLVVFHQVKQVLHTATERENFDYLFLTLTVKNVDGAELKENLDLMMKAWDKFSRRTLFKNRVKGWFRALEITRNKEHDQYHPHFHVILAVRKNYFTKNYVKQETWRSLWQQSLKVDYEPIIYIQKCRPNKKKTGDDQKPIESLVAEGAKYTVKATDYIVKDKAEMDKVVQVFDEAMKNRRLIAFGGILKEIWKELRLKPEDEADLINIDGSEETNGCRCKTCGSNMIDHLYEWTESVKKYIG